jgi:hypothetical protein
MKEISQFLGPEKSKYVFITSKMNYKLVRNYMDVNEN